MRVCVCVSVFKIAYVIWKKVEINLILCKYEKIKNRMYSKDDFCLRNMLKHLMFRF